MAENKVSVEITLEEKAALRALTALTKEIQKTEDSFSDVGRTSSKSIKEAEEAFKKGMFSISKETKATSKEIKNYEQRTRDAEQASLGFFGNMKEGSGSAFKSLVGGVTVANLASSAIIGTANALKGFIVDSVNGAIQQENAINQLNQALRASGDFSLNASKDMVAFASSMQQVSIYGDEVTIAQLALAKSFGASNNQAKELVKAAAELSATFGGSFESRVMQLGKTLTGVGGKLDTLVPGFKSLTEQQLKSGAAFDFINEKIGGSAASQMSTYQGKVTSAANAFSDLQEEMGRFVIENGYVTGALDFAKTSFNGLIAAQRTVNDLFGLSSGPIDDNKNKLTDLGLEYNKLTESIDSLNKLRKASADSYKDTGSASSLAYEREFAEAIVKTEERRNIILQERQKLRVASIEDQKLAEASANKSNASGGISPEDQRLIDSRAAVEIQLQQIEADHQTFLYNQHLAGTEINAINQQEELENLLFFEQQKIDAVYESELQKNKAIEDGETQRLANKAASQKRIMAMDMAQFNSEKTINAQKALNNEKNARDQIALLNQTAALGSAILKDGSKEAFIVGKAAALAQVAISTATGVANALLIPDPTPTQSIRAAAALQAKIMGALSAATIAATAIKGYEEGGIVGGTSYSGDKIPLRINSGEMILNRQDQTTLFNGIKSGEIFDGSGSEQIERLINSINSQPINLMVDGRAIATVVRKEINSGFRMA